MSSRHQTSAEVQVCPVPLLLTCPLPVSIPTIDHTGSLCFGSLGPPFATDVKPVVLIPAFATAQMNHTAVLFILTKCWLVKASLMSICKPGMTCSEQLPISKVFWMNSTVVSSLYEVQPAQCFVFCTSVYTRNPTDIRAKQKRKKKASCFGLFLCVQFNVHFVFNLQYHKNTHLIHNTNYSRGSSKDPVSFFVVVLFKVSFFLFLLIILHG